MTTRAKTRPAARPARSPRRRVGARALLASAAIVTTLLGLVAFASLGGPRAETPPPDGKALSTALDLARTGDWTGARASARQADARVGADIIEWTRLRDGAASWSDYTEFLARDSDWPRAELIRRRAEGRIPADLAPAKVVAFFGRDPALTPGGALRLANALADLGRTTEAETGIGQAWTTLSMTGREQADIYTIWSKTLRPLNTARLDMLLWRGLTSEAENMLPLVDADHQALGRTRIAVRRDADGTTALIDALPAAVRDDPGLAYERYLYRVRKGRWEDAAALMLARSTSAETLGNPDAWMDRRANLAREALQRDDVATAYGLAAGGHGTAGPDYADSEWLAGFIALTRMNDPTRAATHFERFGTLVFTPISLGRAGYWLGLARAKAGDAAGADAAFRDGARYQTSFYGQLAAERAGLPFDASLAVATPPPDWPAMPVSDAPLARAASLFLVAGDEANAAQFFRQAAQNRPVADRAALARMASDLGRPQIGLRIAKDAAAEGIMMPGEYFPGHAIGARDWPVPTEWAMAIARQESEFNPAATSDAGARGLMQLMPATARSIADELGQPYDAPRLTTDAIYNATLGTGYLAHVLDRFDGSYVLATAAYNAGPGRVSKWIAEFGDPRQPGVEPVIWIESIPYSETRNYVMRVLEGMQVYRVRLHGQPTPVTLVADIGGSTL